MEKENNENSNEKLEKIQKQKEIERINNSNIEGTIDVISYHIYGNSTKEYLDFVREVRKIRKEINNIKKKLISENMLDEAYFRKDDVIKTVFEDYKKRKIEEKEGEEVGKHYYGKMIKKYNALDIQEICNMASARTVYPEMAVENYKGYIIKDKEIEKAIDSYRLDPQKQKALIEIIQNYNSAINARLMNKILSFYDLQLEYWEECLEQIEELDDIREFE